MKENRKRLPHQVVDLLYFVVGLLLIILIWEVISFSTNALFLPGFFHCLGEMFVLLSSKIALTCLGYTILRLLISLAISSILGIVLGILAGYYAPLGKILTPLVTFIRSLPSIAVIFLLTVYVKNFSYYVVSLVLFPILYQAAKEGSESVYHRYGYLIRLNGKYHLNNLTRVILPLSVDYLLLGLIQAMGLGMKVEIMAETFAYKSNYYGLGKMICLYYSQVEYEDMMAYVLLSLFVALILDGILSLIKNFIKVRLPSSKKHFLFPFIGK